ncbi:MAG: PIN domain-containing protein [Candidatus Dormibacteraceae bacterium]
MGILIDTTVFIDLERSLYRGAPIDIAGAVYSYLGSKLGEDEDVGMAAITASELLHGVHRASAEYLPRRGAFVESLLAAFQVLPFDLPCARVHAVLWAQLAKAGVDVGAHDRIVAATALANGWQVATANVRHYQRISGLDVLRVSPS